MIATIALLLWPVIAVALFLRLPLAWAVTATVMGGYLLLPTQTAFNFPMLPSLDKGSIPALLALLLTAVVLANRRAQADGDVLSGWIPRNPLVLALLVGLFVSAVGTNLTNRDPLVYGAIVIPALRTYDVFSAIQGTLITLIPFLLARRVFASEEGHRILLFSLVIAACLYSFLALYEVRMSPRLNVMVYGFFPHAWQQHFRSGGWRPIVFLSHGLLVGIFFSCAVLAAAGLSKVVPSDKRLIFLGAGLWLLLTLFLSKTLGAFAITLVLLPVVLLLSRRAQMLVAASVVMIVLSYPTLRYAELVPTERLLSWAESIDPARAGSLGTRFNQEETLLAKAKERPIFGWGGWGRSRVFDEAGRDISITDGRWAITFGVGGWSRYLTDYGLMTLPILMLAFMRRRYDPGPATVVVAIVLTANLIDTIPNAGVTPITWLLAGALAGRLEIARVDAADQPKQVPESSTSLAYSRAQAGAVYGRASETHPSTAPRKASARSPLPLSRFPATKGDRQ